VPLRLTEQKREKMPPCERVPQRLKKTTQLTNKTWACQRSFQRGKTPFSVWHGDNIHGIFTKSDVSCRVSPLVAKTLKKETAKNAAASSYVLGTG